MLLFINYFGFGVNMSCVSPASTMSLLQRLSRVRCFQHYIKKSAVRPTIVFLDKQIIRKKHTMGKSHPGSNKPPLINKSTIDSVSEEFITEESGTDPDDAFEGESAYNMILPNYETENFSFDPDTGILQEREDEIKHYEEIVRPFREKKDRITELNFGKVARDIDRHSPQDFEVSSDKSEWAYVERLFAPKIIPQLPTPPNEDGSYPSGFVAPRTQPGDFPYHVSRPRSHMLPVYTHFDRKNLLLTTMIDRCDGNIHQLRSDLNDFLESRYEREFMSQVAELYGRVKFRGDFEQDFKDFLLEKGF